MNRLRYTFTWLANGRPVPYGDTFTVPASRRDRKKVLRDARRTYLNRGHRAVAQTTNGRTSNG